MTEYNIGHHKISLDSISEDKRGEIFQKLIIISNEFESVLRQIIKENGGEIVS